MDSSLVCFIITAMLAPVGLAGNLVTILALITIQEIRKHVILVNLSIFHTLFIAYIFMDQLYWTFIFGIHEGKKAHFASSIIHAFALPLYLSSVLQMFLALGNIIWTATNVNRSLNTQWHHTRFFMLASTLLWTFPALVFLLYVKFDVPSVLEVALKYPLLLLHFLFVICFLGTVYYISIIHKRETERLLGNDTVVAEEWKKQERRPVHMYAVLCLSYSMFALLPLVVFGIVLFAQGAQKPMGSLNDKFGIFLLLWPLSSPPIFYFFYRSVISERRQKNAYINLEATAERRGNVGEVPVDALQHLK